MAADQTKDTGGAAPVDVKDVRASGDATPRGAERVKIEAFVKVWDSDREFVFHTRDLSQTGLFLCTKLAMSYPFKVGSRLDLELYDHDAVVTCQVTVVRIVSPTSPEAERYPPGFGVQIEHIDRANRERIQRMIDRQLAD